MKDWFKDYTEEDGSKWTTQMYVRDTPAVSAQMRLDGFQTADECIAELIKRAFTIGA